MSRTFFSKLVMMLLLVNVWFYMFNIQSARADGPIYIKADGSIDPPTAPIQRNGDAYTLTGNITSTPGGIVVEADNIVVDGAGFTVEGAKADNGIYLNRRHNVTLQNMNIKSFYQGITLSSSTNCSIVENNVTGNGHYGIWLDSSSNNSISGNIIANNSDGIYLTSSCDDNCIGENKVTDNLWYGIGLFDTSDYNNIIGNTITNSYRGVGLSDSHNNSISGNAFTGAGLGLQYSYSNSVENNTVNGKPLVYLEGATDQSVGDAGQVVLVSCNRIRVENLSLSQTSTAIILWETHNSIVSRNNVTATSSSGISLISSSNNSINGNDITNNAYNGITLAYSSTYNSINGNNILDNGYCGIEAMRSSKYNSIVGNNITDNDNYGIRFEFYTNYNRISGNNIMNNVFGVMLQDSSGNNTIIGNTIANNVRGIYLYSSIYNTFYHNNFISNTYIISGPNFWDNGYPSGGNYWDTYAGTDDYSGPYQNETGSDNIGDSPIIMDGNPENVDNYPLMKAYVQFENQTIHILAGGTIDPPTAPIRRNGDVYTLTDNIGSPADGIVVERDNIVIDGSGLTVEGAGADYGILLDERENVTIQNINIKNFYYGIVLNLSRSNSISRNNITDNGFGIWLEQSSRSNITGNTITNNYIGISLYGCYINTICHNNFIENTVHVNNTTPEYLNFWDNGCEGNFWSNYNGTDLDSDGVGDTLVPCEGMDNCPLMNLYWNPCDMNHDLKVDMKDIGKSAKAFGTRSEKDLWNPHADITGPEPLVPDGTVDMRDISIIARNFMEHYP